MLPHPTASMSSTSSHACLLALRSATAGPARRPANHQVGYVTYPTKGPKKISARAYVDLLHACARSPQLNSELDLDPTPSPCCNLLAQRIVQREFRLVALLGSAPNEAP
jgi:hypothetical protein